jgi:uncharacterized protein YhfF
VYVFSRFSITVKEVLERKYNNAIERLAEDEYDGTSLVEFIQQIFNQAWRDIGAKPAWYPSQNS